MAVDFEDRGQQLALGHPVRVGHPLGRCGSRDDADRVDVEHPRLRGVVDQGAVDVPEDEGGHALLCAAALRSAAPSSRGARRPVDDAIDAMPSRPVRAVTAAFTRSPARHVLKRIVAPLDRLLFRISGGRLKLSAPMIPSLMLFTTGAKSGLRRESPLMCFPEPDGSWYIAGSNFGLEQHPAWSGEPHRAPGRRDPLPARAHPGDGKDAGSRADRGDLAAARAAVARVPRLRAHREPRHPRVPSRAPGDPMSNA